MDEAIRRLTEGNHRFMIGRVEQTEPRDLRLARRAVAHEQHPFAIILACADSRVGPEMLFDQGVGELFEVRTAGHVVDDAAMGSIEYGVEHLHCALIVVLAHERCGAVTAAVEGGEQPGSIGKLVEAIQPAVEATKGKHGDPVKLAAKQNAHNVAAQLAASPVIAHAIEHAGLEIAPAYYDLDSGHVDWLRREHNDAG
jgi:carbonic anhydrase